MASRILRSVVTKPALSTQPLRASVHPPLITPSLTSATRPFSSLPSLLAQQKASPGQSSNVGNTAASSPEGQEILQSRATDDTPTKDTSSLQNPVSNPEDGGIGGQEEQTQSQGKMKRDPDESSEKKREEVLKWGQGRKLDAGDEGTQARR